MSQTRSTRVWTDPRLLGWATLEVLVSPLLLLAKLKRHFLQDYEWEFDLRRWRIPNLSPDVPPARIVFVGAGPGELIMIDRLVETLERRLPGERVGICLRNPDTLARLREERPHRRLSLWPFDFIVPVARWLRAERPEFVVFVDRFRFPTFACAAARSGAGLALVNGRSRKRESALHRLFASVYRWQFGGFRLMAMQSEPFADAARPFAAAGCRIAAPGSLKADLRRRELSPDAQAALEAWLRPDDTPLVAAASTADPEEEGMVLDAFLALRREAPCRLLLAPRDVRKLPSTLALIAERGLAVSRRSRDDAPADVMLLDTFGELAAAYAGCHAAYVGGFRGRGGGHNVLEPFAHAVPVAYGPNPGHFEAERRMAEGVGAGTAIPDAEALTAFWLRHLRDDAERVRVGALGRKVLEENRGAVERTVELLASLLEGPDPTATAPSAPPPRTTGRRPSS